MDCGASAFSNKSIEIIYIFLDTSSKLAWILINSLTDSDFILK